jgi:hypothetical protein
LSDVLKAAGSRSVKGSAGALHRGLMVTEVALAVVLLTGSGLLIRSFMKLQGVDKGFALQSTVTMNIQLDPRYSQPERQTAFFRNVIDRTSALPGVETAAAIDYLPLGGGESISLLSVEGYPFDPKIFFEGRSISPRYFAAMGIPLLQGRDFTDDDSGGHPAPQLSAAALLGNISPARVRLASGSALPTIIPRQQAGAPSLALSGTCAIGNSMPRRRCRSTRLCGERDLAPRPW